MDPISAIAPIPPVLRPTTALVGDVAAVLREGQILAGEVLEKFGGGSVLIGVAGHRVPADSHIELPVGESFIFEVKKAAVGEGVELRILRQAPSESALLSALRSALAGRTPAGERLGGVLQELGKLAAGGGQPARQLAARELAARLESFGLRGERPAPEQLHQLVRESGLGTEAALLRTALNASPGLRAEIAQAVRSLLVQNLSGAVPGSNPAQLDALLAFVTAERAAELVVASGVPDGLGRSQTAGPQAALHGPYLPYTPGAGPQTIAELVRGLEGLLRRAAELVRSSSATGHTAGGASRHTVGAPLDAQTLLLDVAANSGLRELLVQSLLGEELSAPGGRTFAAGVTDLKVELMRALALWQDSGDEGAALRGAISRALGGLEAEQLLNLARREGGEPQAFGIPFWDGTHWATVQLAHEQHARKQSGRDGEVGKLSLAVDFTSLGPVRADLALAPGRLAVRIAARPELAQRLRDRLPELEARLERAGRKVTLAVVENQALQPGAESAGGVPGAAPGRGRESVGELGLDIRYLQDHHLVDEDG